MDCLQTLDNNFYFTYVAENFRMQDRLLRMLICFKLFPRIKYLLMISICPIIASSFIRTVSVGMKYNE
jgi:hypothetical protein